MCCRVAADILAVATRMCALKPEPQDLGAVERPQGHVIAVSRGHDAADGNERGRLRLPAVQLPVENSGTVRENPQSISLQDALCRLDESPDRHVRNDVDVELPRRPDLQAAVDVLQMSTE